MKRTQKASFIWEYLVLLNALLFCEIFLHICVCLHICIIFPQGSLHMTGIKGQNSVNSIQPTLDKPEEDTVKVGLEDFSFLQVLGKGSFGKVRHTGRPANSHAFSVKGHCSHTLMRRNHFLTQWKAPSDERKSSSVNTVIIGYYFIWQPLQCVVCLRSGQCQKFCLQRVFVALSNVASHRYSCWFLEHLWTEASGSFLSLCTL